MRQTVACRRLRTAAALRIMVGAAFAIGALIAHAGEGDGFSPQDRKQFVEAPERFKKTLLPSLTAVGGIFWLDDDHLLISGQVPEGWRAEDGPPPATPLAPAERLREGPARAFTLDLRTGARTNAPYPGRVVCAERGTVVFQLSGKRVDRSFWGRYGEPLAEVTPSGKRLAKFAGADCAPASYDEDFETLPLLPEDGVLRVGLHHSALFWKDQVPLQLVGPDGKPRARFSARGDAVLGPVRYKSFLDSYVIENLDNGHTLHAGAWLSRDGVLRPLDPDPFLHRLTDDDIGYSVPAFTRLGVLWIHGATPLAWRRQGLYLREKGRLLRIEDQYVTGLKVAPGGCRVFYSRQPGNPNKPGDFLGRPRPYERVMLDLCD